MNHFFYKNTIFLENATFFFLHFLQTLNILIMSILTKKIRRKVTVGKVFRFSYVKKPLSYTLKNANMLKIKCSYCKKGAVGIVGKKNAPF